MYRSADSYPGMASASCPRTQHRSHWLSTYEAATHHRNERLFTRNLPRHSGNDRRHDAPDRSELRPTTLLDTFALVPASELASVGPWQECARILPAASTLLVAMSDNLSVRQTNPPPGAMPESPRALIGNLHDRSTAGGRDHPLSPRAGLLDHHFLISLLLHCLLTINERDEWCSGDGRASADSPHLSLPFSSGGTGGCFRPSSQARRP
jgi:hypothetical protein